MGIYQLFFLDRIPDYAVCNESVKLVKKEGYPGKSRLVNALLRNIIRESNNIRWPDIHQDPIKYISIFYSFPEWMVKRWIKRFGLDLCLIFCQASNQRPNLTLRVNSIKISMKEFRKKLIELGLTFEEGKYLPTESLIIKEFCNIGNSPLFRNGLFSIQDESSMLAARLLNPSAGETIIDMCSGPGGKTTHLAQLMNNSGRIIAFEKNQKRLKMVRTECNRLGVENVNLLLQDSSKLCRKYFGIADKILVDVPCSGTGVFRKKPDIKWKKINKNQLKKLNNIQEKILNVASNYLKPGGEMLYSTCSVEEEENDGIIKKFKQKNTGFDIQDTSSFVQRNEIIKVKTEILPAIQLLPGYSGDDIDGFYMVKIKKLIRNSD